MEALRLICRAIAAIAAASCVSAHGSPYPEKPVRLISQFPPGGGTDVISRLLAPKLSEAFGQPVIVENKPGASGNIAAEYVAKSSADGYTILAANNTLVISAAMPRRLPFDVPKDFEPIAIVAWGRIVLAVHPSVKAVSVTELIALLKSQPNKWSYSSCGTGTVAHLAGELFKQATGTSMLHVPYKGCGPALADGVAGHVPVLFNNISGATAQARGGRLRVLALVSPTRSEMDATVPSIAEYGLKDFDASGWFGFLAPAGTPREVIEKLGAEFGRAARAPEMREKMRVQFFDQRSANAEEFKAVIRSDIARWSKVIRDGNIQPD